MASTRCILPKPKTLVCQLDNQEKCIERESVFNSDFKVIIKDLPEIKRKSLEDEDYASSTDDCDSSCANSGKNSPIPAESIRNHPIINFTIKDGEESGTSSGYESGYITPCRQIKKKRKLSKRKELLSATLLASHLEADHAKIHKPNVKYSDIKESEQSTETSDVDSTEIESTSSDDESLSSEEEILQNEENGRQFNEKEIHQRDGTDAGLAQAIIRQLSRNSHEVPIVEARDLKAPSSGIDQIAPYSPRSFDVAKNISICESYKKGTDLRSEENPDKMRLEIDLLGKHQWEKKIPTDEVVKAERESSSAVEHKPMKTGKQRFRWNLLFNLLVWLIVPLPIWLPFVDQTVSMYLIPALQGIFVLMWVVIVSAAAKNMIILYRYRNYNFKDEYPEYTDLRHLVAISCYKEPVPLIARSVQSLADQTEAKRITMVISFEEKTPDVEKKIEELTKIFCNSFERLLFTVHPFGLPNEIPGKCSNANYGLRESVKVLQQEMGHYFDPTKIIVTTCDADSNFHSKYIEALTSRFLKEEKPETVVFQAPLLYNWGLDGTSFVTRVTGLLRSTLMMGALIPFNINTMSIFSFSLKLCMNGNFVHPSYQMDDIICLIRWMGVTGQRLRIPMIPVPVISGPTSGSTIELELGEWARQARRWTIGAGEVFHYYVIKANRIPFLPAFSWGVCFLTYYGILLCSAGLYGVSASISMALLVTNVPVYITYTMYGMAALQQACFLVVFILDVAGPRLMNIKEHISFIRNVLHWILTPVVLIGYSLVELYALHEVMIRGKEVCKHGASKKSALQAA